MPSGEPVDCFRYRADVLHAEGVSLHDLARRFGTPCYVYSRAGLEARWKAFDRAFAAHPHLVCFAVKANGNLAVLDTFARLGPASTSCRVGSSPAFKRREDAPGG